MKKEEKSPEKQEAINHYLKQWFVSLYAPFSDHEMHVGIKLGQKFFPAESFFDASS